MDTLGTMSEKNINSLKMLNLLMGTEIKKNQKIIFYLPTWKDYNITSNVKIVNSIILNKKIQKYFKDNDIIFVYKPHSHDEKLFENYKNYNIHIIKNSKLLNMGVTIYDILNVANILITDYSSVYIDFLLLNKPIIFYCPDIYEFKTKTGFILKPYNKLTPGDKAYNAEELLGSIKKSIRNPQRYRKQRIKLRNMFFTYKDDKASERIINVIKNNNASK